MKLIYIISIVTLFSCEKIETWDNFVLEKTLFKDTTLRIDGYFYQINEDNYYDNIYCFYKNGIILYLGGDCKTKEEIVTYIKQEFNNNSNFKDDRSNWGLFEIKHDTIRFERYYISDDIRKKSYVREGKIINDSTFHISVSYRSNGTERKTKDETYHFRKYSPKPDSTQTFL